MMATTLRQIEEAPEAYPDLGSPSPLTPAAAEIADVAWQRLEAYVAHRWTERTAAWIVQGPGEWNPPLAPATIVSTDIWRDDEWQDVTLSPSPFGGLFLPGPGPYRITATVGGGSPEPVVPDVVLEAFRRLAEYLAQKPGKAGARVESISAGSISLRHSRHEAWAARAMQNSGAGDLLRPFRRAP